MPPLRASITTVALAACFTVVACRASTSPTPEPEPGCVAAAALSTSPYFGKELGHKTLALSFDDGPGARTLELSQWLAGQNIHATFFVNGHRLQKGTAVLASLVADGHVVANHGQTHANLTKLEASGVVAELEATDALIAPFVLPGRFLFRPPYGAFDVAVFNAIDGSSMRKYVGPIDWDIGADMANGHAADWDCWQPGGASDPPVLTVKACGDLYLAEIRAKQRGIVLLHDPYFIEDDPAKGGTVDMVKYMVPILKSEGYTFVNVDDVPSIAAMLTPKAQPAEAGVPRSPDASAPPSSSSSSGGELPPAPSPDPCAGSRQNGGAR